MPQDGTPHPEDQQQWEFEGAEPEACSPDAGEGYAVSGRRARI